MGLTIAGNVIRGIYLAHVIVKLSAFFLVLWFSVDIFIGNKHHSPTLSDTPESVGIICDEQAGAIFVS